jgi:pimeloyl-ACP methyl ester carboxylesterase
MTKSATIPHSDIRLRRDGAGDRAIAFMHGFLDDQHVCDPAAELTASEFEIVRLDLGGFGERKRDNRAIHVRPVRFVGPVLVLRGTDDPLLTAEIVAARVAERFDPNRTTVTAIEESGHWPHIERPSAVAAAVNRFLAHNLAAPAVSTVARNG